MEIDTGKVVRPHVLTVTGHYDLSEGIDGREFSLSCPGVSLGDCVAYVPCDVADCPVRTDPRWDGGGDAHGVEHTVVDGEWMVPTGECYYLTLGVDGMPDAASYLRAPGTTRGLDAGEYEVLPEYEGDGDFRYVLVPADA